MHSHGLAPGATDGFITCSSRARRGHTSLFHRLIHEVRASGRQAPVLVIFSQPCSSIFACPLVLSFGNFQPLQKTSCIISFCLHLNFSALLPTDFCQCCARLLLPIRPSPLLQQVCICPRLCDSAARGNHGVFRARARRRDRDRADAQRHAVPRPVVPGLSRPIRLGHWRV